MASQAGETSLITLSDRYFIWYKHALLEIIYLYNNLIFPPNDWEIIPLFMDSKRWKDRHEITTLLI